MSARRAAYARTVSALEESVSVRSPTVDLRESASSYYNTGSNTARYALIEQLELQSVEPSHNNNHNSWSLQERDD